MKFNPNKIIPSKGLELCLLVLVLGSFRVEAGEDPFAGISENPVAVGQESSASGMDRFFSENFGFRRELMSEFGTDGNAFSSRQSIGFETLKKFSSETTTFAAVDFQGRLVRRDGFTGSPNDMEGMERPGWFFEYHNAYADFYNPLGGVGTFNFRVGRFYVPFGLNLQTDTHGSLLQLSNERNFGFERDWYAGFWGSLNGDLNYDAYYLAGSGYRLRFDGQGGLGAVRISLADKFSSENGLEGGLSVLGGRRLSSGDVAEETARFGMDGRVRWAVPTGSLSWTSELSAGRDDSDEVLTQIHQLDYLAASRRFGLSVQYRQFYQDFSSGGVLGSSDTSLLLEVTWYFRNDVGNSNLQWVKLNVERPLERQQGDKNVVFTLQYYQYW